MPKVFFNGKVIPLADAKLSVLDRGFLYGDGVFESLRTYNRRPFLLDEHIKRLLAGAKLLKIKPPCSPAQLKLAVQKTMASNPFREHYIKIIVTRGESMGHGLDFSNSTGKATLIILDEDLKEYPASIFTQGWKAIISSVRRAETPTSRIKSLCYLDNALAMSEARRSGAREAFMLDEKGRVAEGTISNIFIVKHGEIHTPPTEEPILAGITRNLVMKLARQSALKSSEKAFVPKDIFNCDECFITFSGAGIVPVNSIWNRKIGNGKCGPITDNLIRLYQAETQK